MKTVLNLIVKLLSNTIGQWHLPYINKKFPIEDYFKIEEYIRGLSNPFVVGAVRTHGNGSNLLIGLAQCFSPTKKCFRVTHVLAHIGIFGGFRHRVVESLGPGIREVPLLQAIGQRDDVVLRKPNPRLLNDEVCKHAIEYIQEVAIRDSFKNIDYDTVHDYSIITLEELKDYSNNNIHLDCSETIMQALEHGFKMTGQKSLVKMVDRVGKKTWTPAELYHSELFITFYDSKEGFIDGDL